MSAVDVLVVGSGGREHALAWKIRQSPRCGRLYAAPGNPGVAALPDAECFALPMGDLDGIVRFAAERRVGLVVVGPEAPLAAGLADRLGAAGIPVFGPAAAAARIESSKTYARELMTRVGAPQPRHDCFQDYGEASAYLDSLASQGVRAAVVKASGLAAGKGVIVCDSLDEARDAAREMLVRRLFGEAGAEILIEERLEGEEASLLVVTDGREILPFLPAQDYKRIRDGDQGPNTGGMGSYAPTPILTPELYQVALETIVRPVLGGLEADGCPFRGCLYAGLMKSGAGLRVIEFNCRFGDPETQAILPLLESDLVAVLSSAASGSLEGIEAGWKPGCGVCVVLASGGYPGSYETGKPIHGLSDAEEIEGVAVFHAGTSLENGQVVTAGGRVLNVTGAGRSLAEARSRAYAAAEQIRFEGCHYRRDIAERVDREM
jgi:phosphoribosylamine---glycine ligase